MAQGRLPPAASSKCNVTAVRGKSCVEVEVAGILEHRVLVAAICVHDPDLPAGRIAVTDGKNELATVRGPLRGVRYELIRSETK